ncbi:sensor histidine kinase [Plantactinospora sp. WMMB334]|uniref:sensor histidine kinase n=1 Tax=Plantactinospora sp. WMMB334 TaxID=3404119 RepID=UPI003B95EDF3
MAQARPQEVRAALRDIEATSRSALAELRRTLRVLRSGAPGVPVEFGPAADLPDLVARAVATGMGAELALDLAGGAEPPEDVGRSAYRIVQEALTNVVKHAGPVRFPVGVTVTGGQLQIEVANEPGRRHAPADPRGQGLIGMRERVDLYRGSFAAGPTPAGGFRITVRVPYPPVGRTTPTELAGTGQDDARAAPVRDGAADPRDRTGAPGRGADGRAGDLGVGETARAGGRRPGGGWAVAGPGGGRGGRGRQTGYGPAAGMVDNLHRDR